MTAYKLGYLVGFICGFVVLVLLIRFASRANKKYEYDERQELVRGRGYKYGFFITVLGGFILTVLSSAGLLPLSEETLLVVLLFVAIGFYAVYCILKDAYFGIANNKKQFLILDIVIILVNGISFVENLDKGITWTDPLPDGFLNLMCEFLFLAIFIAIGIKSLLDRREAE